MIEYALARIDQSPTAFSACNRLIDVCSTVVDKSLDPAAVGLMRLMIVEAARFPDLAIDVNRMGRLCAVEPIVRALHAHDLRGDSHRQAEHSAGLLIDAVFAPLQLRALLGENLGALRPSIRARVEQILTMLAETSV